MPARRTCAPSSIARAIPLYVYTHGSLADITAGMRSLGARLGLTAEAEAAASSLERDLERVRASVAGLPRPRTALVIGREPQSLRAVNVSGGVGFLHDLLELAGGDNVFGDVTRESAVASTETLLARRPEAIIELHYLERATPGEEAQERQAWNQLPGLPAVKSGRVHLLYGGELVVPGPRVARDRPRLRSGAAPRYFGGATTTVSLSFCWRSCSVSSAFRRASSTRRARARWADRSRIVLAPPLAMLLKDTTGALNSAGVITLRMSA